MTPDAASSESARTSEIRSLLRKRWRRVVRARQLYQLADPELAMLIYTAACLTVPILISGPVSSLPWITLYETSNELLPSHH